jgi:hypothetical protein
MTPTEVVQSSFPRKAEQSLIEEARDRMVVEVDQLLRAEQTRELGQ